MWVRSKGVYIASAVLHHRLRQGGRLFEMPQRPDPSLPSTSLLVIPRKVLLLKHLHC